VIAHVVLFRPRPDLSATEREAFAAAFQEALAQIPTVRAARIGRRVNLQRFYDQHNAIDFPYCAVIEFESEADLRKYLDHPAHDELGQRFYATSEATLAYDFEMIDGARVRDLFVIS
jgi:hypothetical protein